MEGKEKIADGIYQVGSSDTRLTDGMWMTSGAMANYLVESESKLASIPNAEPGDIAFTAGFKKVWQLDVDGQTWTSMI